LLAVDHPLVALALGARAQAGEIGAGGGLGEQLAPDLLALERRGRVALALLRRAPCTQRRDAHAEADLEEPARHGVMRFLLVVDHLLDRRAALPAPVVGPGNAGEAGLVFLRLPLLGACEGVGRALARALALGGVGPGLIGSAREADAHRGAGF